MQDAPIPLHSVHDSPQNKVLTKTKASNEAESPTPVHAPIHKSPVALPTSHLKSRAQPSCPLHTQMGWGRGSIVLCPSAQQSNAAPQLHHHPVLPQRTKGPRVGDTQSQPAQQGMRCCGASRHTQPPGYCQAGELLPQLGQAANRVTTVCCGHNHPLLWWLQSTNSQAHQVRS